MPRPLTLSPIRIKVYNFIVSYKSKYDGNSPTLREICRATGINSVSVASFHLNGLKQLGYLELGEYDDKRRIQVIGAKWVAPAPIAGK